MSTSNPTARQEKRTHASHVQGNIRRQSKCACGGKAGLSGKCGACHRTRLVSLPGLVQAKLSVGPRGDRYEQEADEVADWVMRMPDPSLQRKPIEESEQEDDEEQEIRPKSFEHQITPLVQRQPVLEEGEGEETLRAKPLQGQTQLKAQQQEEPEEEQEEVIQQRATLDHPPSVTADLEGQITRLRTGGQPLDPQTRGHMESRFGHDFGRVRVHAGPNASHAAETLKARAFTFGNDIVFGAGQYRPMTNDGKHLLAHELTHVLQQRSQRAIRGQGIQRQVEANAALVDNAIGAAESAATPDLIVSDEAAELETGQMRKSEFLSALRPAVCRAAEEALEGTGQTTEGCPYLARWFDYYQEQDSRHVERALRRYAPEASGATTAREYIPHVAARVGRGVAQWAQTGELPELPEGLSPGMLGGGGLLGGLMNVGAGLMGGVGRLLGGVGGLFAKRQPGARVGAGDAREVQARLGEGQPLDGEVRGRMERAFGEDFAGVRVHWDGVAAGLAQSLAARAFTVGEHVAFGAGEYRPGTPEGDALMAHELTHVVQQGGGRTRAGGQAKGVEGEGGLEEEADRTAMRAVVRLWGGRRGIPAWMTEEAVPRLRTGLQLQRCGTSRPQVRQQPRAAADFAAMTPWQLSRVPDDEFQRAAAGAQPTTGPRVSDYQRAARLARQVFADFQINFDVDTYDRPLGQPITGEDLQILDSILSDLLASQGGAIRRQVGGAGGRGLPTQGSSGSPTLRGRARGWSENNVQTRGEFAAKAYRLERSLNVQPNRLEEDARTFRQRYYPQIPAGPSPVLTDQERRLAHFVGAGNFKLGFYFPAEDTFYLKPGSRLSDPQVQLTARHETVHLLGGRERTRQAFVQRYGSNWYRYWFPFEEGVAEWITSESMPPSQRSISGVYAPFVAWVQRLIAMDASNRDALMQAFFTGNVPASLFQLIDRVPPPPPPR